MTIPQLLIIGANLFVLVCSVLVLFFQLRLNQLLKELRTGFDSLGARISALERLAGLRAQAARKTEPTKEPKL